MNYQSTPAPKSDAVASIETFETTEPYRKSTVVCQINGYEGVPIDAAMFAKLILAQIKLLENLEREMTGGKVATLWTLSELAVINDRASFSITGVEKRWHADLLRKAKRKAVAP